MESIDKDKKFFSIKYNLSEIIIYFNNEKEKIVTINKMEDIKKISKNVKFEKLVQKFSQSESKKNDGKIGDISSEDFDANIFLKISKTKENEVSDYFCEEKEKGFCIIFKLNKLNKNITNLTEMQIYSIKNGIFMKKIEKEINFLISEQRKKSNIKYKS